MAGYLLLSLRTLRAHRCDLANRFSYVERVDLRWLQAMLYVMLLLFLLYVVSAFVELSTLIHDFEDRSLYPAIVASIYLMGFLGLRQPRVFERAADESVGGHSERASTRQPPANEGDTTVQADEDLQPKYRNSAISKEQSACILHEMRSLMCTEKLYLDSSLSLPKLATRLRMSPNIVSQAINEAGQTNFFDFVNRFRVSEAKMLLSGSSDNVLKVAHASGFNSKSAFYKAFGKHCGQTPREYRLSVREDVAPSGVISELKVKRQDRCGPAG